MVEWRTHILAGPNPDTLPTKCGLLGNRPFFGPIDIEPFSFKTPSQLQSETHPRCSILSFLCTSVLFLMQYWCMLIFLAYHFILSCCCFSHMTLDTDKDPGDRALEFDNDPGQMHPIGTNAWQTWPCTFNAHCSCKCLSVWCISEGGEQ